MEQLQSGTLVNMRRILVTGAAGFIAFHVVESLLRDGFSVVGLDNFDPFYPRTLKERNVADLQALARATGTEFLFVEADLATVGGLEPLPGGIDTIVHLAGKAGVKPSLDEPAAFLLANVTGTLHLLEWARGRGIANFIFGSSSSVYGSSTVAPFRESETADRPASPYAATKRAGELLVATYAHLYGMKAICLRFFTVYGPRQRPDLAIRQFTTKILAGSPIDLYGAGDTGRDYTYVTDIVAGLRSATERTCQSAPGSFEVFNLGGGRVIALLELVRLIEDAAGRKAVIVHHEERRGDMRITFADLSRAESQLGYRPEVTIEAGIPRFVAWLREDRVLA